MIANHARRVSQWIAQLHGAKSCVGLAASFCWMRSSEDSFAQDAKAVGEPVDEELGKTHNSSVMKSRE